MNAVKIRLTLPRSIESVIHFSVRRIEKIVQGGALNRSSRLISTELEPIGAETTADQYGTFLSVRRFVSKPSANLWTAMSTTDLKHEWIPLSPAWIKQARKHTRPQ
jgi:hypothetical protein